MPNENIMLQHGMGLTPGEGDSSIIFREDQLTGHLKEEAQKKRTDNKIYSENKLTFGNGVWYVNDVPLDIWKKERDEIAEEFNISHPEFLIKRRTKTGAMEWIEQKSVK